MKTQNILNLLPTIFITLLIITGNINLKAEAKNPNEANNNTAERGWSLWQNWDKLKNTNIDFGISTNDIKSGIKLEKTCFPETAEADIQKKKSQNYWYRISNSLESTGKGEIEYGCWENGRFKSTITIAAIIASVASTPANIEQPLNTKNDRCRRVQTPSKQGLVIRSAPSINSPQIGGVDKGETIILTSNPATIRTVKGRNWVAIESPVMGWIANGQPGDKGNLILCKP